VETRNDTHEAHYVHYVATNPKLIPKNSFALKWVCRRADVENGSQVVIDTLYREEIVEYPGLPQNFELLFPTIRQIIAEKEEEMVIGGYISIDTRRFLQMNEKFLKRGKISKRDDVILEGVTLYHFVASPA